MSLFSGILTAVLIAAYTLCVLALRSSGCCVTAIPSATLVKMTGGIMSSHNRWAGRERCQVNVLVPSEGLRARFNAACSEANVPGHRLLAHLLDLFDAERGLRRSPVQHPLAHLRPVPLHVNPPSKSGKSKRHNNSQRRGSQRATQTSETS